MSDNSHYSIVKDLLQLTSGVAKTPKIQHSTSDQSLDCLNAQLRAANITNRFGVTGFDALSLLSVVWPSK
jgi:hypothetical protein